MKAVRPAMTQTKSPWGAAESQVTGAANLNRRGDFTTWRQA